MNTIQLNNCEINPETTMSNTNLQPGTQAVDKNEDNPEDNPMRVLNPNKGKANDIKYKGKLICNYPGNEPYPDDDTVVVVAYESGLNAAVNNWEEMLNSNFTEQLQAFREQWSVYPDEYYFPKQRLKTLDT